MIKMKMRLTRLDGTVATFSYDRTTYTVSRNTWIDLGNPIVIEVTMALVENEND